MSIGFGKIHAVFGTIRAVFVGKMPHSAHKMPAALVLKFQLKNDVLGNLGKVQLLSELKKVVLFATP